MCMYGCHSDEDCSASESCRNNLCVNPCDETPCGPNAICSVANQRALCSCSEGFIPNPTPGVACVRAPGPPCFENRDCTPGSLCFQETCMPVCASDSGCLGNERCVDGTCRPVCRHDTDCRAGELCSDLVCTIGCRSDSSCANNKACVNYKCLGNNLKLTLS